MSHERHPYDVNCTGAGRDRVGPSADLRKPQLRVAADSREIVGRYAEIYVSNAVLYERERKRLADDH